MNTETIAALNRINRRFYSRFAATFAASRSQPWPGWDRALAHFLNRWSAMEQGCRTPSILDVGCGNGRFGEYLVGKLGMRMRYLGLDQSEEMLELARQRLATIPSIDGRLARYDLGDGRIDEIAQGRPFDLVVACGLLHHIPGFEQRRALLRELSRLLAPDGVLLVSFWQFGEQERFRRRILEWCEHNRDGREAIDLDQLEPGDHLLRWGSEAEASDPAVGGLGPRRYCHHSDESEVSELIHDLGLEARDRYRADGRTHDLNLYCVLQMPGNPR